MSKGFVGCVKWWVLEGDGFCGGGSSVLEIEFNVDGDWWFDGVLISSTMVFSAVSISMIAPDAVVSMSVLKL